MRFVPAFLLFAAAAAPAWADVPDGDVFLSWNGSRISTGRIPEGGTTADVVPNVRVFAGTLGDPAPTVANDPGLMGVTGTFPVPSSNILRFRSGVLRYDPVAGAFPATPSGDYFHISLGGVQAATPGSPLGLGNLFTYPVDDAASGTPGQWHHHPFWQINNSAPFGIYLSEVDIANSTTNIYSDRFFFLWDYEANPDAPVNDVEGAYNWVNANLVPAPGVVPIFVSMGLFAVRRRRSI